MINKELEESLNIVADGLMRYCEDLRDAEDSEDEVYANLLDKSWVIVLNAINNTKK